MTHDFGFIFTTNLRDLWSLSGPLRVRKMQPDIQKVVTLLSFDVKSIFTNVPVDGAPLVLWFLEQ